RVVLDLEGPLAPVEGDRHEQTLVRILVGRGAGGARERLGRGRDLAGRARARPPGRPPPPPPVPPAPGPERDRHAQERGETTGGLHGVAASYTTRRRKKEH